MAYNNSTADRELRISRLLNAPRELVWKVWTDPNHIKNWWGPNGFTNTISTMELKKGGQWKFVMHGPDGTDYNNHSEFVEIVKPERIVFKHISHPHFVTTVTFEAQGNKTLLNWHMLFESREEFEAVVKVHKADKGLEQNIEKLQAYLQQQEARPKAIKEVTITRILNAPRNVVYNAWVNPVELAKWWGPRGFTTGITETAPVAGGKLRIQMVGMGYNNMVTGNFVEVVPERKLIYTTSAFADANGSDTLKGYNEITFEDYGKGKTKLTIYASIVKATPELQAAMDGMYEGWSQSIDKLSELVTAAQGEEIFIRRSFNAPRALVFKAFTQKEHLEKWFAPDGCSIRFTKLNVEKGGTYISCMAIPGHDSCWCTGTYVEVTEPEVLIYTSALCDENGNRLNAVEAGKDSEWPQEAVVSIIFTEDNGVTQLMLHQNAPLALAKQTGAYPSWLSMLDNLETDLGK
ncbi:MAG: SRPBCC domain-containing protein [Chitinophagales bacterium]